jgi:hypothetical protein
MSKKEAAPLDTEAIIKRLRLFNEKAKELGTSNYTKQVPDQRFSISCSAETGTITTIDVRPDEEARKAMILTLRFFENKELSLNAILSLYQDLPIADDWKTFVLESAEVFEADMKTALIPTLNGKSFTPTLLFKTFMYGQYCHAEESFVEDLRVIKQSPFGFMFQQAFDAILSAHLKFIGWLSRMNEQVIVELEKVAN